MCARVYGLVCVSVRTRARPLVCARMVYGHMYPLAAFAEVLLVSAVGGGVSGGRAAGRQEAGSREESQVGTLDV